MIQGINNVSFKGGSKNTLAAQYLERKAAKVEADLAERIKTAGRLIINKNNQASKSGNYIPVDAYFGPVPKTARNSHLLKENANETIAERLGEFGKNKSIASEDWKETAKQSAISFFA